MNNNRLYGSGQRPTDAELYQFGAQQYKTNPRELIDGFQLFYNSPTIKAYVNNDVKSVIIAVRGTFNTTDVKADAMGGLNQLTKSKRYIEDKNILLEIFSKLNPEEYDYYMTGHSLGGMLINAFFREFPFLKSSLQLNGAYQPIDFIYQNNSKHTRYYTENDPLYKLGGRLFSSNKFVIPTDRTIISAPMPLPTAANVAIGAFNYGQGHMIDNFHKYFNYTGGSFGGLGNCPRIENRLNDTLNILRGGSNDLYDNQNSRFLHNIGLFNKLGLINNNYEKKIQLKGGAMTEEEEKEFKELKEELEASRNNIKKLESQLAENLEESMAKNTRKKRPIEQYDLVNLNKFLKTNDSVLENPEVFKYEEDMTAFDRNLKANKNYYRAYQKKFIEDWTVSAQECVILYYGVGSGKTMIAVNCAEQFTVINTNAHVYFLTPASLVLNTIKEMYRRGIDPTRKDSKGEYIYNFVSYQQLLNSDLIFKENSLLIIDEVHNLRNFKTMEISEKVSARKYVKTDTYSLVGTKLGITLLQNENKFLRTIFMTGTLFVNSKRDIEPIISLGYKKTPLWEMQAGQLDLIEINDESFKKYYSGLISFYRIPNDSAEFPKKKYYFEPIKFKGGIRSDMGIQLQTMTKQMATRILKAKQKTNEDIEGIKELKKAIETDNFNNLEIQLPEDKDPFYLASRNEGDVAKANYIIKFLQDHKDEKTLIYSQFKSYVLEPLLVKLDKLNIKYGFISGDLPQEKKLLIVNDYNTSKITVLFFTLSIKEGISFKETNNIIVNEPYWNYAIMEQILARGIRLDSHAKGNKSTINLYMLVAYNDSENKEEFKKFIRSANDIMNNDIKTLIYPSKRNEKGEIETITMKQQYMSVSSRDAQLYCLMFDKQESINEFETRLLKLPRFEDVNNNENNEFIKEYNSKIYELEKEKDVSFKEKIRIKKEMYSSFYEKQIKIIDNKVIRFKSDSSYRQFRNPNVAEEADKTEYKNITSKIADVFNNNGTIEDIFKLFKIDKKTITTFQANFTPENEVAQIIKISGIADDKRENLKILEPTCGIGNVIKKLLSLPNKSNFMIDGNELHSVFNQIASVIFGGIDNVKFTKIDFMEYNSVISYDYILGNPPFNLRTQQNIYDPNLNKFVLKDVQLFDIDFVIKAYNLLADDGVLCMIISDRYERDKVIPRFEIFRKIIQKILKNNFESFDVGSFKSDSTITKTMETQFPMKCIRIVKKGNIILSFQSEKLNKILFNDENEKDLLKAIQQDVNNQKIKKIRKTRKDKKEVS
jgi:superfamily II DNA or RNA helicase